MGTLPESADLAMYQADSMDYPSETFLIDKNIGRVTKVGGGIEAVKQAEEEAQRLAREQENTETETKEYGPGAGVQ